MYFFRQYEMTYVNKKKKKKEVFNQWEGKGLMLTSDFPNQDVSPMYTKKPGRIKQVPEGKSHSQQLLIKHLLYAQQCSRI